MMTLYKYTTSEFVASCIENGIYASRLDKINDPYEGKGIRYKEKYRVVCLTSSPFQMLMWAYYGNHRGCCVEFDVSKIEGIRKVDYIKEFLSHEDMTTEEVIESLYCKGNEWNHENEYRLVYHAGTADKSLWTIDEGNIFLNAPVKRVIFGLAAEMDFKYVKALECLKDYNDSHSQKIEVTKCKLMSNKYQLEADKQFDLAAEIESVKSDQSKGKYKIGDSEVYDGSYTEEFKPAKTPTAKNSENESVKDFAKIVEMKQRMHQYFLKPINEQKTINREQLVEKPSLKFKNKEVLVRSIHGKDFVMNTDGCFGRWEIYDFDDEGLLVYTGQRKLITLKSGEKIDASELGCISFETITTYDLEGDTRYNMPILYCDYRVGEGVFSKFEYTEKYGIIRKRDIISVDDISMGKNRNLEEKISELEKKTAKIPSFDVEKIEGTEEEYRLVITEGKE